MSPLELRNLVKNAVIYKMSLGKNARFRAEATAQNVLVFGSEKKFYEAVVTGDENEIARRGQLIKVEAYPSAGATANAYSVWRGSIDAYRFLPENALIVHWETDADHLYWGLTSSTSVTAREEIDDYGQAALVFHRALVDGWHKTSIEGIPLSNLHPKARDLAINRATLNRIQTDAEYFRNLILDKDTSSWEQRSDWQKKAKVSGWHAKDRSAIGAANPKPSVHPFVKDAADYFFEEIRRVTNTAMQTVAYANGQTVTVVIKAKDTNFTRLALEEEIVFLLEQQKHRCALTDYRFRVDETNPHLRLSLDRKDSNLGYVAGNLQVVTRAANYFKSASDEQDWALKAEAMERMAIATQQRRKAEQLDKQIESDANAGRLEQFAAKPLSDHKAGLTKAL